MLCIFQTAKLHKQSTLQADDPLKEKQKSAKETTQQKIRDNYESKYIA